MRQAASGSETLIVSERTWLYLCGNVRYATYCAGLPWMAGEDVKFDRLREYYSITGKKPELVYADKEYRPEPSALSSVLRELGVYVMTENELAFVFRPA